MRWFDEYLSSVAQQIRVKRIRQPLMRELEDHLLSQKEAYLDEGHSEKEAERRAIADMGNALLVGSELDRVHRPQIQWTGILLSLFFLALGVMLQCLLGIINYGGVNYIYAALAAGIILLVGMTDYTFWQKLTFPALGFWLILCIFRILRMSPTLDLNHPIHQALNYFFYLARPVQYAVLQFTPECLSVAAPVLTAFLITHLRGHRWGAFAVCTAIPALTALMSQCYLNTGYNYNAMMQMALTAFAVLLIAIWRGFFQIHRKGATIIWAVLAIFPIISFVQEFAYWISSDQPYFEQMLHLLKVSKPIGRGGEVPGITDGALLYPDLSEELLIMIIHRFGWIPFGVLTAGMIALLVWCFVQFIRMENRMGSLLGLTATLSLCAQLVLYYINNFTSYTQYLCLPLVSLGNTMLAIDAILVGVILSALRGQNMPEPILHRASNPKSA